MTLVPCQQYVDAWVLVTEDEIRAAMKLMFERDRLVIEGAAGVAVAAYVKTRERRRGQRAAIVICGGNIAVGEFKRLVF